MTLSKISKFLFLFIFATALLASCTKEEIIADDYTNTSNSQNPNDSIPDNYDNDDDDDDNDESDDYDDHEDDDDDLYELAECIEFVFPIAVIFPDMTDSSYVDEEDFEDALEDWYDSNNGSTDLPTLQYPVEIIVEDGSRSTINNDTELHSAVVECEVLDFQEDYLVNDCFTATLPISFVLPDSTSHSVNNADEVLSILLPYYTQNPEADEPELVFPIEVTLSDGSVDTIESYDALEELEDSCDD